MFSTILSCIAALLLLTVIVTVHELGHFLVGRKLGFGIEEFAVGMGPVLFKKEKNGIRYCIRALPIGGSCMFTGEDSAAEGDKCFNSQKSWKRFLVILAGPMMNVVLALALCIITLCAYGNILPAVQEVVSGGAADRAGMQAGDVLISVDGSKISSVDEAVSLIRAADGIKAVLTVERDGSRLELPVTDFYDAQQGYNVIGIQVGYQRVKYHFFRSVGESASYLWEIVRETFSFFGRLFQGKAESTDVSGPVGTVAYISSAVRYGPEIIFRLAVVINMSLAIMNLLPLPALDGGRLTFIVIEWFRGKPIPPEKEGIVHFIGIVLLLGLMVFLTYNDIRNLIAR